jgi:uncharacterized UPF0160 family protein
MVIFIIYEYKYFKLINKFIKLKAIYQDSGGSWRIQAVPVDPNSFSSRKKLLEPFGGLRDDNLSEKVFIIY